MPKKKIDVTDNIENLVSNLGTTKDKREYNRFIARTFNREELDAMYTSDWLSGKIVDIPIEDMLKRWRYITCPSLTTEQIEEIAEYEESLSVIEKVSDAMKWARLYGGAIILMIVDGQGESDTPLDTSKIRKGQLKNLIVLDRWEVSIGQVNTSDITDESYRLPTMYSLPGGKRIHHSRVIRFDGVKLPWYSRQQNNYWNGSIIQRVYDAIINSQSVANAVNSITNEASINVISVPDLMTKLSTPRGEANITRRFMLADKLKSFNNMLLLDDKETFQKHAYAFSGLPDLIDRYLSIVTAASDIPATRLLGQSPGGLNSTGEGDQENYLDMLQSNLSIRVAPRIRQLDNVMVPSLFGSIPKGYRSTFNPLKQMSEDQIAINELNNANRDRVYWDMGVISPYVVARQLRQDETYQFIDDDYLKALSDEPLEIDAPTKTEE